MRARFNNIEFQFSVQKIVDTNSNQVEKHELLTRFYDPKNGVCIEPEKTFNRLILDRLIDQFTMTQLQVLSKTSLLGTNITCLSINLEPSQLENRTLIDALIHCRNQLRVDFSVEITERYDFTLTHKHIEMTQYLNQHGITISLDDFGIGGSGFYRLMQLPVSEIKLDRLITCQLAHCAKTTIIIESLVKLCSQLGIVIIGEGVENRQTSNRLRASNITNQQGYYWGEPSELELTYNQEVVIM
ncbi:EAL domain-containing protein [Vibrio astriarenae]